MLLCGHEWQTVSLTKFLELTTLKSPDYQTEAVPGNTGFVFGEYTFGGLTQGTLGSRSVWGPFCVRSCDGVASYKHWGHGLR